MMLVTGAAGLSGSIIVREIARQGVVSPAKQRCDLRMLAHLKQPARHRRPARNPAPLREIAEE